MNRLKYVYVSWQKRYSFFRTTHQFKLGSKFIKQSFKNAAKQKTSNQKIRMENVWFGIRTLTGLTFPTSSGSGHNGHKHRLAPSVMMGELASADNPLQRHSNTLNTRIKHTKNAWVRHTVSPGSWIETPNTNKPSSQGVSGLERHTSTRFKSKIIPVLNWCSHQKTCGVVTDWLSKPRLMGVGRCRFCASSTCIDSCFSARYTLQELRSMFRQLFQR
jgi:hypothetical protein